MLLAVAPSGRALPTATKTRLRSVKSIPEQMLPEAAIPDASTRDLLSTLRGKYGAGKNVPRRLLGINKTLATAAQQNAASKKKSFHRCCRSTTATRKMPRRCRSCWQQLIACQCQPVARLSRPPRVRYWRSSCVPARPLKTRSDDVMRLS